jgi:ATP-dependent Clp protease ATP-binding subunit ClpX
MEGHVYTFQTAKNGQVEFDTSQLTFAFLGAFSGIEEYSNKKMPLGFVTQEQIEESKKIKNIYNDDTLKKYGLLPEFVGRCDTIVTMNSLGVEDFIKIIKTSDKSQLLLYKYLLKDIGIDFIYDEKTIEAIAKKANELGLGARSIKKIVENALSVASYQLFARNKFHKLIISPETIEDNKAYILK